MPAGKDHRNLDLVGSSRLLYWSSTAPAILDLVEGLLNESSIDGVIEKLEGHEGAGAYYTDGFGDNHFTPAVRN